MKEGGVPPSSGYGGGMTQPLETLEDLTDAATSEVDDEPASRTLTRLAVAAVIGAVAVMLLALMGSQWIWWMAEYFKPDCTSLSGPFCGGFFDLWNGPDSSGY
jgi:hypothetical protein